MAHAPKATVTWDKDKKHWQVRVQIGEEVIKRTLADIPQDASDDVLRSAAMADAHDEGYEVHAANVAIVR